MFFDIKKDSNIELKKVHNTENILPENLNREDQHLNSQQITNLNIKVSISPLIPVFGAVKVDLTGLYKGIKFKVGFDHIE